VVGLQAVGPLSTGWLEGKRAKQPPASEQASAVEVEVVSAYNGYRQMFTLVNLRNI
jgi:hypothetical protein